MTLYKFDINKKVDYLKSIKKKQIQFNLIILLVSFSPLLFILTSNYLNIFVFKPFYILILITFIISNILYFFKDRKLIEIFFDNYTVVIEDDKMKITTQLDNFIEFYFTDIKSIIKTPESDIAFKLHNKEIITLSKYIEDFDDLLLKLNQIKNIEIKSNYNFYEFIIKWYFVSILIVFFVYFIINNPLANIIFGMILLMIFVFFKSEYKKNTLIFYMINQNYELKLFFLYILIIQLTYKIISSILT